MVSDGEQMGARCYHELSLRPAIKTPFLQRFAVACVNQQNPRVVRNHELRIYPVHDQEGLAKSRKESSMGRCQAKQSVGS